MTYPQYQILSIDNEYLSKLTYQINRKSTAIEIPVDEKPLPFGNCYWNVDSIVRKQGGKMVLGWEINLLEGSHLAAVHHAIYQQPDGSLTDVTAKMPTCSHMKKTIFIPDNKLSIDLNKTPAIGMQFHIIDDNRFVRAYIEAYRKVNELEKKQSNFLYSIGYKCENNRAIANGLPPTGASLSKAEAEIYQQLESNLHQARILITEARKALKSHMQNGH
ncbi:hypothetical protein [Citrobacter braakii]|uniref:hypothetical protein n=1 Tax=Citrobacter braakii TaxID=57706 RepID=UPI002DB5F788|nr:hypothetical protein [Citrobacter braakii]MEB8012901.1 hypothetical protein [Citrobacter braakii]